MSELTLSWQQANDVQNYTISNDTENNKHPGSTRLGRDPSQCDLVLNHPTVSKLHVEIYFASQENKFYLRNLRQKNPPTVDGQRITTGEAILSVGSTIYLGQLSFTVTAISQAHEKTKLPQTVIIPPKPSQPETSNNNSDNYGLRCPHCHHISPYERIDFGCQWCGTSLAGAASVLIPKES